MSLLHYEQAFSQLKLNQSAGKKSPHKVALLLAVMELMKDKVITDNHIYFNDQLKAQFSKEFAKLASENDRDNPHLPYFHLKTSNFWYHHIKPGKQEQYNQLSTASGPKAIDDHIAFAYLDDELYELMQYEVTRSVLRHALYENLTDKQRLDLLDVGKDAWHWLETEAIVQDYFSMLNKELKGIKYNKTEHRNHLTPKLNNRSKGSIEFKHQNISAVLIELGQPYISGYKPAFNYQAQLKNVVLAHLAGHQNDLEIITSTADQPPKQTPVIHDWQAILDDAPPEAVSQVQEAPRQYLARNINYAAREERNRKLGERGEEFVIEFEKQRLIAAGYPDLADEVLWVSKEKGDGLGYDVRSIDIDNDQELHIEVKTTQSGKYQPFYISANEVNYSKDCKQQYCLYRVYDFNKKSRIYQLHGDVSAHLHLSPTSYRASFRSMAQT